MTELLNQAVEVLRRLPASSQDSFAQAILSVTRGEMRNEIDAMHLPFVLEGLAQLARGEHATDAEIAEAFRSFEA